MQTRGFTVKALGEVAIRCANLEAMVAFYGDILGLPRLTGDHSKEIAFFQLGESYGGHTAILALFQGEPEAGRDRSALHHFALTVDESEQEQVVQWYEANSIAYNIEDFDWVGWRGIFTKDPEGNTVELVAKRK